MRKRWNIGERLLEMLSHAAHYLTTVTETPSGSCHGPRQPQSLTNCLNAMPWLYSGPTGTCTTPPDQHCGVFLSDPSTLRGSRSRDNVFNLSLSVYWRMRAMVKTRSIIGTPHISHKPHTKSFLDYDIFHLSVFHDASHARTRATYRLN
jgi:hypothetical protein